MLLFTKYKCTWLTAISVALSRCTTCQDVLATFNSLIEQNPASGAVCFIPAKNCHSKIQTNLSEVRCRLQVFPEIFGS